MSEIPKPDTRVARQFTILVYPFRHALAEHHRARRLEELGGRWVPWWRRLTRDELECALDDTYFFLPYVRDLLFPETTTLPAANPERQVEEAGRLASLPAEKLVSQIPGDAVLRLTFDPERLDPLRSLQVELRRRGEQFSAPFDLCWVDALFFPQRVGLLAVKVEIKEDHLTSSRVNDSLYYIRLVHPPKLGWELASWRLRADGPALAFKSRDLVDFLLQGLTEAPVSHIPSLEGFLDDLRLRPTGARYTETQFGQVYGQVFHLYTYACLGESPSPNIRASPEVAPTTSSLSSEREVGGEERSMFESPSQRILYELATNTDTSHPDYAPHRSHLGRLLDRHQVALWANWQAMVLSDNVVFLGAWPSGFTLRDLPHNIENDYFHLYLFTLFQKIWLSTMFGDLLRRETNLQQNLKEARRLWDAFMSFQNHYWYSEVTRRSQGVELYRQFQQGLGVLPLYEEIRDETRELQGYYERKFERRVASLLNFIAFVGLPAGLLVDLFSNALVQKASWSDFLITAAAMYAVIGALWLVWRHARRQE